MAAIIYVFTAYIHVPSHTGYTHVGDGFLYLAASLLPAPFAAAAGAIGAGLADLLSGYGIWAPGTVIIKVLTAFCFTNRREKLVNKRNVLGILPALVLCVGGYYLYEALITGNFTAPALGIPGYLTQVALSSVVYLALGPRSTARASKRNWGKSDMAMTITYKVKKRHLCEHDQPLSVRVYVLPAAECAGRLRLGPACGWTGSRRWRRSSSRFPNGT